MNGGVKQYMVLKVNNIKSHESIKTIIEEVNITCCCHVEDRAESIRGNLNYRFEVSNNVNVSKTEKCGINL